LLGGDDPVCLRLAAAMDGYQAAREHIRSFVDKADIIEDF